MSTGADEQGPPPAATLFVGIHGVLELHPWIRRGRDTNALDQDTFSLAVNRSIALGFAAFNSYGPRHVRWGHNDAGGDWAQDGSVRQIAWLRVDVAQDAPGQRIPLQPAIAVLGDSLDRVGRFRPTGLHALVPVGVSPDARADLASMADWFALADPAGQVRFTVTLAGAGPVERQPDASRVLTAAREAGHGQLAIEPSEAPASTPSLAPPLVGQLFLPGRLSTIAFTCTAHEWSLDLMSWVAEVFVEAARAAGTTAPTLVTVSLDDPSG